MNGSARLGVFALSAALCATPVAVFSEESLPASADTEVANPIEILRTQVEAILASTKTQLQEAEDLLFNEPDNPDIKAIVKDLRASIAQLSALLAQLPETTLATGSD